MSSKSTIKFEKLTWKELLINSSAVYNARRLSLNLDDPKRELYETLSKLTHYAYMIEGYE